VRVAEEGEGALAQVVRVAGQPVVAEVAREEDEACAAAVRVRGRVRLRIRVRSRVRVRVRVKTRPARRRRMAAGPRSAGSARALRQKRGSFHGGMTRSLPRAKQGVGCFESPRCRS
jgi:hypothetical protein